MLKLLPEEQIAKRKALFREARKLGNVSLACKRFGISRKTYYKWWKRFKSTKFDPLSLVDQKRTARRIRRKTPKNIVKKILRIRKRTRLGPERIRDQMLRLGYRRVPCMRTISRILKKNGLAKKWKHPHKKPKYKHFVELPGQLVQMDVKYVPYRINGRQHYQYTAIDCATRLRVLRYYEELCASNSKDFLDIVIRSFPFKIKILQTDNGVEFTHVFQQVNNHYQNEPKVHALDKLCNKNGITHRLIPPGQPQFNGYVERSHRTDMEEFYRWKRHRNLKDLQKAGRKWQDRYNYRRPHSGIEKLTPKFKLNSYKGYTNLIKLCA